MRDPSVALWSTSYLPDQIDQGIDQKTRLIDQCVMNGRIDRLLEVPRARRFYRPIRGTGYHDERCRQLVLLDHLASSLAGRFETELGECIPVGLDQLPLFVIKVLQGDLDDVFWVVVFWYDEEVVVVSHQVCQKACCRKIRW
jgi:hypothetical protein